MGWMSPRELNDDPERWLNVPHELHESLLTLQEKLFPGFNQKLKDANVHCFLCEGSKTFEVFVTTVGRVQVCTGYVGDINDMDNLLLNCVDRN